MGANFLSDNNNVKHSALLERLKYELSNRKGQFNEIAEKAGVKVEFLHFVMRKSSETRDHGVRKVEAVLSALNISVDLEPNDR